MATTNPDLADQLAVTRDARRTGVPAAQSIFELLTSPGMRKQFEAALPSVPGLTVDKFVRVAMTTLRTNRKLLQCDQGSLFAALMLSAQLGLEPNVGPLGHAYLVPYGKELTFIVGYKGYIELARRSGQVSSVYAEAVHQGDRFVVTKGLHRDIVHEPDMDTEDAPLTHVYAVARFNTGEEPQFVVLTRGQVERFRSRSMTKNNGPWVTDYEAMALKTGVRRLATWLPLSVEFHRALVADGATIVPGVTAETFDAVATESDVPTPSGDQDAGEKRDPTLEERAAAEVQGALLKSES